MIAMVEWFLERLRLTLSILAALVLMGTLAYLSIPKEADPDIQIPFFSVIVFQPGISPEDAERLIVRPLETELKTVEGLKQMTSTASQNYAGVNLEFDVNFDKELARQRINVLLERQDVAAVARNKFRDGSDKALLVVAVHEQDGRALGKICGHEFFSDALCAM